MAPQLAYNLPATAELDSFPTKVSKNPKFTGVPYQNEVMPITNNIDHSLV